MEGREAVCDWKAKAVVVERKFHVLMVGAKACACCFNDINSSSANEAAAMELKEDGIGVVVRRDEPETWDLLVVRIVALLLAAALVILQQEDCRHAEFVLLCS